MRQHSRIHIGLGLRMIVTPARNNGFCRLDSKIEKRVNETCDGPNQAALSACDRSALYKSGLLNTTGLQDSGAQGSKPFSLHDSKEVVDGTSLGFVA